MLTNSLKCSCIHIYLVNLLQADQGNQGHQAAAAAIVAHIQEQQLAQEGLMRAALMRLGLSHLAATEFTNNGIINMNRLRSLTEASLEWLIKQILRAGHFIPFTSQQYLHAIRFWANRMHIIGLPYDVNDINEPLAEMWVESMEMEKEAADAPTDMVKMPEAFKKDNLINEFLYCYLSMGWHQ